MIRKTHYPIILILSRGGGGKQRIFLKMAGLPKVMNLGGSAFFISRKEARRHRE